MYIIVTIDPLSQPGIYDIEGHYSYESVKTYLLDVLKSRLYSDPDFNKIKYYKKIIDENFIKYSNYIDEHLPEIEDGNTFQLRYYGYFCDQSLPNIQYDTLYNIHKLE
jgi:hypothetical protein